MSFTAIANLIKNDAFAGYVQRSILERSALFKSGIASADPLIAQKCREAGFGGDFVTLPYYNALETAGEHAETILKEDGQNIPVDNVSSGKDIAVICRRAKAFGSNDLAADWSGTDPMKVVADQLADYWNVRNQERLFSVLKGVFAHNVATDGSDLVLDITGETGNAAILSKETILLAAQLLGDRKTELTAIAMNSMVDTVLAAMDTNAGLYRASEGPATLAKYNGRDIIVDDGCAYNPSTKVAEIYLFGRGAIAYNDCPVKVPFEMGRNPLMNGGQDFLVSRIANICHLRGYKWNITETNPPNDTGSAEGAPKGLSDAASWSRVWKKKEIRCVKLIAKLG